MTLKEGLQQEKELTKEMTKDMTKKEKLSYIWYYYKWFIIGAVCLIVFIADLVIHYVTKKEEVMFAAMVNFSAIETEQKEFEKEFTDYIGLDTGKYSVDIRDDITVGLGMSLGTAYRGQDLLAAYIGGEQLDVMCTCDDVFFDYAYEDMFLALSRYMSEEEIEKYSDRLYYVDAVVVEEYNEAIRNMDYEYSAEAPDPDKPEDMEEPVPVGIYVDDSYRLNTHFKCENEEAEHYVVGVIANSHRTDNAKKFIEFLAKTEE